METEANTTDSTGQLWLDGHTLTVRTVVQVARHPRTRIHIDSEALNRMRQSLALKQKVVDAGLPVYGVTSGFGDSSNRQISDEKVARLQTNLIRFLSCGIGPEAAAEVVRATMLIRANCLARGHSAIRPEVLDLLLDCISADILPLMPERGTVGASGDLVPLSYLAALLTGEGNARYEGRETTARGAFRQAGLAPVELQAKEGLALVNGTSFMAGFAALAAYDARRLAFAADLCTALTVRVLGGKAKQFASFIFDQKPHPGSARSAHTVRELLGVPASPTPVSLEGTDPIEGFKELEEPIQDRYSIRCSPQVVGILHDTLDWVDTWVHTEINSSNDNPLFDVAGGQVHNGGNFYGGHIGHAMDALKSAAADVGDLLDRQLALVVDEKFNNGLTPNLIPRFDEDSPQAGLHHGFKGMQIAASSLAAEALHLTMPATSFSRSTECHNQDKVSMGTIAARDARTVLDLLTKLTAIHLLALCQAADLRGSEHLTDSLRALHDHVRSVAPFADGDRPMQDAITAVAALINSGELEQIGAVKRAV